MLHFVTIQKVIADGDDFWLGCSLVIVGIGATGQRHTHYEAQACLTASCISLLSGRITLEFEKQTVVFIHSIHKSTIRAQFCYLQYFLCSLVFQQPYPPVTRQYELTTRFRDDSSCSLNRKPPK